MFCQKCGYKIKNGSKTCENCGAEIFAEYCEGFWDILDPSAVPAAAGSAAAKENDAMAQKNAAKREAELKENAVKREHELQAKFKTRLIAMMAICAILLVVCLVQTIRLSEAEKKHRAELAEKEEVLVEDSRILESQTSENQALKEQNAVLETEKTELELQLAQFQQPVEMETEEKPSNETVEETESEDEIVSESDAVEVDESEEKSDSELLQ